MKIIIISITTLNINGLNSTNGTDWWNGHSQWIGI